MANDSMSEEDRALFREYMRCVKPLDEKNKRVLPPPKNLAPLSPKKITRAQPQEKKQYYLSDTIQETVLSESVLTFCKPGLGGQRFRELRRGEIPWEACLDLHGCQSQNACDILCEFIRRQLDIAKRCILIIHGKGGHLGAPPVIKNLVNRWLPQIDDVLAFHSALPKDGGHGAVYVLLKRKRGEAFCD